MSYFFVEYLTLTSWFSTVFPYLLHQRSKNKKIKTKVFFIDGSPLGIFVATVTLKYWHMSLEKFLFYQRCMRNEQGISLYLLSEHKDIPEIQKNIEKSILKRIDLSKKETQDSKMFFYLSKKIFGDNTFSSLSLKHLVQIISAIAWKIKNDEINDGKAVFFAHPYIWKKEIERFGLEQQVELIFIDHGYFNITILLLFKYLCIVLKNLSIYQYWFQKVRSLILNSAVIKLKSPCYLAAEYNDSINFNCPELNSSLFFLQNHYLDGRDVFVTFNIVTDPLDHEKFHELQQRNIGAVVLKSKATKINGIPIFNFKPTFWHVLLDKKKIKIQSRDLVSKWLNYQITKYFLDRSYWIKFFEIYKVKIYVVANHHDSSHCVMTDAMRDKGGIIITYQRSFEILPAPLSSVATDIMFGFSKECADIRSRSVSEISYYVVAGYLRDYCFSLLHKRAQEMKGRLRKHGVHRIVAFLDQNSGDDPRWHPGNEWLQNNYIFLLEKVLTEPWLGLLIKPKKPATLKKRLGKISDLLQQAEKTGRCYVFDSNRNENPYPVALAALAADVVIHSNLHIGTATVEAALTGVPTLLLDSGHWREDYKFKPVSEYVIFSDWEDVWKICFEHWRSNHGIVGFGDWSSVIDQFDPFRDGKASERMSLYLKWLLEGFKTGLSRDTVMADAAERYCKQWGKDKIIEIKSSCSNE